MHSLAAVRYCHHSQASKDIQIPKATTCPFSYLLPNSHTSIPYLPNTHDAQSHPLSSPNPRTPRPYPHPSRRPHPPSLRPPRIIDLESHNPHHSHSPRTPFLSPLPNSPPYTEPLPPFRLPSSFPVKAPPFRRTCPPISALGSKS